MTNFDTLLYTKEEGVEGAVAHISLNRPQVLNAYNIQMRDDFSEALAAAADDPEVRSLLVSGQGRAFCAGADLTEFGTAPSQTAARRVRWERDVWGRLSTFPIPIVTAVHGYCIGSGLEIALLSDIRLGAAGTVFSMPEAHLGMIPAAGGTQTLPRNIGASRAMELLLTGQRFDAQEALRLGLLTRVTPEAGLMEKAWGIARQLAALERNLAAAAKECLLQGGNLPLTRGLEMETRLAARALS